MRAAAVLLLALFVLAATAACGGADEVRPTAETVAEELPETDGETNTEGETEPEEAPDTGETETEGETETDGEDGGGGQGDPQAGREVFTSAEPSCGTCHTLEEAGATGTAAPSLDEAELTFEAAVTQIRNGGGGMPPYEGQLTEQQINDVAAFVVEASGGG